jgi:hypothetical protein
LISEFSNMVSGLQIRAARGFLCWDRRDLARKSVVPLSTIERIETGEKITGALNAGLSAIKKALEAEGIEFIDGDIPGVLLHPKKGKTARRTSPR